MSKRMSLALLALVLTIGGFSAATLTTARANSASTSCLTPAAQSLWWRIKSNFPNVYAISTCRPGARVAGTGHISRHSSGNAIDFRAPGNKGAVVAWLIANHSGGTMTYTDSDHIHADIGPHWARLAGHKLAFSSKPRSYKVAYTVSRHATKRSVGLLRAVGSTASVAKAKHPGKASLKRRHKATASMA